MLFYNLVVRLYGLAIFIASANQTKARQWLNGRRNWRKALQQRVNALPPGKRIWVHCASYGEFEQGKPVIEALLKKYPGHQVILTFFSPSGYEAFKNWPGAGVVCYLPLDTPGNAADFIGIVDPVVAIFIKYEFWINFLFELQRRHIPCYLVSAVFKPHHPFFKMYGGIFRRSLSTFNKLLLQDQASADLLATIGVLNCEVCGDTRYDRVLEIREKSEQVPAIASFKGSAQLIIAGSTWPGDEELVLDAFQRVKTNGVKLLLAPHNVDLKYVKETTAKLEKLRLSYSLYTDTVDNDAEVLVLNVMGLLSRAYAYADCAYIGGGFNDGLHNTLEAAVYNIPVTFYGKDYDRYNEAVDLLKLGAATHVTNGGELTGAFSQYLNNQALKKDIGEKLAGFFENNAQVTLRVLESIRF